MSPIPTETMRSPTAWIIDEIKNSPKRKTLGLEVQHHF
ncbi:hypothetical protein UFOVP688_23 [uncultured Caudovirales phage]|uniref:Uncharacterized protein n=1 Tax=uncultured Caudovirales phage TaxID=2100421 RepID=A0A6J5NE56_9CAUD|nr:hypothetical protein UFOVP688_23 [uncultured Caudovirales phage]